MRALIFIVALSARQRLAERGVIVARAAFYGLILFVFSRLWDAALAGATDLELLPHQLVWYLAITEWIVLSAPPVHTDVEDEIRRGDLVYRLTRPASYLATRLAESLGDLLVRLVTLAGPGFAFAWLLTGRLPTEPALMLWLLPLGLLAGVLVLLMMFAIGFTSLWLHDCRPLYWVWQKGAFILGGLLLPLELYPPWLREIASASPFAALFHGPGRTALGQGSAGALQGLALLGAWTLVTALGLAWAYRRGLARIELGGG